MNNIGVENMEFMIDECSEKNYYMNYKYFKKIFSKNPNITCLKTI